MKLTWFGDTALRAHIGGEIIVIDADAAGQGVDRNELDSGADHVVALTGAHERTDGKSWKPRPVQRLLDAGEVTRAAAIWSLGDGALLIDPDEDMPLLVLGGPVPALGRWVERAVVLLVGVSLAQRAEELIGAALPRLIVLAGAETEIEQAIAAIRDRLDGTGLMALERGLAVEV